MTLHDVSLADRFDLDKRTVLLGGIQALVRVLLMQKARDEAAGLEHRRLRHRLPRLAARRRRPSDVEGPKSSSRRPTSSSSPASTRTSPPPRSGAASRSTCAARAASRASSASGTARAPASTAAATSSATPTWPAPPSSAASSPASATTTPARARPSLHHSEFALVDAMMPILSPAGVQEVLDYGLLGWALSRYTGCWVGLKCVKDTIEVTEVVDGDPHRLHDRRPRPTSPCPKAASTSAAATPPSRRRRGCTTTSASPPRPSRRANRIDRRVWGNAGAKIGIVSCGKSWLDTEHALDLLGLDDAECRRLGITTYKVGMVWPLDMASFREWAHDLEHIIVVEEKRKLIEVQIKEAIFDDRRGRRVTGWKNEPGETIFSVKQALDPVKIARTLGTLLALDGVETETLKARRAVLEDAVRADNAEEIAVRKPWFCSGCPHNTSTRLPEGARAYAGIGCHYMVQWMDRDTEGFTHMGGEGANWIGEAPFSTRPHIFQNLGDGTYNHSGVQAIRAALAAGVNITYKILFNDAVAMTGGQPNEGGLTAQQIARELQAMGVKTRRRRLRPEGGHRPPLVPRRHRHAPARRARRVQREMQEVAGVSAIIYIQTCAAEKRRRRKRGQFPDPDRRVFINPDVCEGCGDCGVQSNCVSILPLETEFGRKRMIDQSSCNKDFSCLNGFCPSFVTLEGAQVRKAARAELALPDLPAPKLPPIDGTYNIVITGVGGTGVVTVGALIAMAAHLEGKGAGEMEMAGLAQKGGAVSIHCRIAETPARHLGDPRRGRRGRRADRRRPRRLGRRQDPRPDGARPHPRRGQRPRDHHRRLHPRPRLPAADRPADAGAARPARRRRRSACSTRRGWPRSCSATRSTPTC